KIKLFFDGLQGVLNQYFYRKASSYELIKYCQGKALADILFAAYLICYHFLKTHASDGRAIVYSLLSKIIGAQKLLEKTSNIE
ncbi:MAG: hypothetical protein LRY43_03855, partial [Gammaproteobacteria bacterium]|nr:hypothetical protein [Gammaproteobacteria bacterium]